MPSYRIGFGSDFNLNNSNVGIGTTLGRKKLDVIGVSKGDFNITGVSTLTVYGGFVGQKQNISVASTIGFSTSGIGTFVQVTESETGYLSLVGEYNTVSEDIIVDEGKIFEVSVGSTVSPGTLESVSIQSHFSVPNGGSNDRPDQPVEGMVRFNDDLNTLEFYNGIEWRQFTVSGASGRGVFMGGSSPSTLSISNIEFITIPTQGNGQNFGDLTVTRRIIGAVSSGTRGVCMGGYYDSPGPGYQNVMDYMTIPSAGNAIDFGDIGGTRANHAAASSSTRGLHMGQSPGSATNTIEYIEIQTLGNALDFGDLFQARENSAACASPTRAVTGGGQTPSVDVSSSEFVTISSKGNGVKFGELTSAKDALTACSSPTRGIFAGGLAPGRINAIDYVTIASVGNAIDFGDLTNTTNNPAGTATSTRGVVAGGNDPGRSNVINFIEIASTGNAQDFGDLSVARGNYPGACSDSHGGLGGF